MAANLQTALERGLHSRNGFVRKGCAMLLQLPHRLASRTDEGLRQCPPVLANSFPKSGTHLLEQVVSGLPGRRNYGAFLASMTSSFQFRERTRASTVKFIRKSVPGEIVRGHLFFEEEYADLLEASNVAHYFVYRDLRDVVISEAHYLRTINRWHRLHPYFRDLPSVDDAIMLSIRGLPDDNKGIDFPNIASRFSRYAGWLNRPGVCCVRYEDLIGEQRDEVIARMVNHYADRCSARIDADQIVAEAIAQIDPQRYRGQVAGVADARAPRVDP